MVARLTGGLAGLAKQRKVTTIRGYGRFTGPHELQVELDGGGTVTVRFEHAIIAAGSEAVRLPPCDTCSPRRSSPGPSGCVAGVTMAEFTMSAPVHSA